MDIINLVNGTVLEYEEDGDLILKPHRIAKNMVTSLPRDMLSDVVAAMRLEGYTLASICKETDLGKNQLAGIWHRSRLGYSYFEASVDLSDMEFSSIQGKRPKKIKPKDKPKPKPKPKAKPVRSKPKMSDEPNTDEFKAPPVTKEELKEEGEVECSNENYSAMLSLNNLEDIYGRFQTYLRSTVSKKTKLNLESRAYWASLDRSAAKVLMDLVKSELDLLLEKKEVLNKGGYGYMVNSLHTTAHTILHSLEPHTNGCDYYSHDNVTKCGLPKHAQTNYCSIHGALCYEVPTSRNKPRISSGQQANFDKSIT